MFELKKGKGNKLIVPSGFIFNRLTVIEESEKVKGKRMFFCKCTCGTIKTLWLDSLRTGRTKSCGCLNSELAKERATTHGDDGTRLNGCWKDMRKRAKNRKDCSVCPAWEDFLTFKKWALVNGYTDEMVLSRRLDTGDYEPSNVLWVSKRRNVTEAHAFYWKITDNLGGTHDVYNLTEWCRSAGVSVSAMSQLSNGSYEGLKYQCWFVTKLAHGTTNKNLGQEELDKIFMEDYYT